MDLETSGLGYRRVISFALVGLSGTVVHASLFLIHPTSCETPLTKSCLTES